ncbi:MAG: helix-turn-helix domain-containing protein, partial [Polyangiaceae bacterium]|nr:helix-turn-helix domain-containing protein [Polyangiaceae bacterium]
MEAHAQQAILIAVPPTPGVVISGGCTLHTDGSDRVVFVAGSPMFRYQREDEGAEALVVAQILELGLAKPKDVAPAFDRGVRTVHRYHRRFLEGGVEGVLPKKRGPKGQRLGAEREAAIRQWHAEGRTPGWMARQLGVHHATVKTALLRMGLLAGLDKATQGTLPAVGEPKDGAGTAEQAGEVRQGTAAGGDSCAANRPVAVTEPVQAPMPVSLDHDPSNRAIDRMLARRGELDDAAPLFASGEGLAKAGVLLCVPMIVASGVLDAATKAFGGIGPAFYGLRTSLMTLLFLALLRIKRPENLKEYSPPELGRTLGLDRAPEVKTLRRKLAVLGQAQKVEPFLKELTRRRAATRSEALGYLYVDGHVRVYAGKHDIPKTHVARMRLALPATQDVWVNDAEGSPLFFVTQPAHPSLVRALPPVLQQVRDVVGERRVTVVFDRGGWSPKLFGKMIADGFDVLTYRKGKSAALPAEQFVRHVMVCEGRNLVYHLADQPVELLGGKLRMRQVTRLCDNGHQTAIVTSREDLPAPEVAFRMFERWRQENFFKYMRQQFAIDALVDYGAEPDDPERLVPNPERTAVDRELRAARKKLAQLEAAYGAAAIDNPEQRRPTMRGFKIAHGTELGIPLREARERVEELTARRKKLPVRVSVGDVKDRVVRLRAARKRLSDGLKMLAYQVETDLTRLVAPHYARSADEGRRLIAPALQSAADIEVRDTELV